MFGISFEHILIVGVILLIVGPRRLPELGNTMGKAIKNFKDSIAGVEEANFKRINNPTQTNTAVGATAHDSVKMNAEMAANSNTAQNNSNTANVNPSANQPNA